MVKYNKETLIVDEFIKNPIKENTKIFFSHFGRYFYASKVLDIGRKDCVLDVSCGEGYGTYSLSSLCKSITGLDINKEYIEMAQKNYTTDNLKFMTYEDYYMNYPNPKDGIVDKILVIETLEHIPKEETEQFIENLLRFLKVGGSAFITMPLGQNEASEYNKFHLNEPSIDVLFDLFSKYFEKINIEIDSFVNSFGYECKYAFLILKNKK
jgi:2-polyprenyl-3-methyl-5-hydroxy-6-metoxy-1,4-benzoquinol methylase